MADDLIKRMGYIALATRLKRISDKMTHSTRLLYKTLDMDIEPNWYLILYLVKETPDISVMEIASSLGFTHQSILSMTNKMFSQDYLTHAKDKTDKRKTVFRITEKAITKLPEIERIWAIGKEVIYEVLNEDTTITAHLDVLEAKLATMSFGERIIEKINLKNEKPSI